MRHAPQTVCRTVQLRRLRRLRKALPAAYRDTEGTEECQTGAGAGACAAGGEDCSAFYAVLTGFLIEKQAIGDSRKRSPFILWFETVSE